MLLSRLLSPTTSNPHRRAATPENPSFNLNSDAAWDTFLGGSATSTGKVVGPESALTWSAWWRGVTLIAKMVAKCPAHVYKTDPFGEFGASLAIDHPAYKLLRRKPNEYQTDFHFKLAIVGHAVNRGNGYAVILRSGPNPTELVLLDPDETQPATAKDGRLWYVTKFGDEERKLPASDVFHLAGFGFDGVRGYPLWQMAKECIGLGLTREQFAGSRYQNGARPGVILSTDTKLKDEAKKTLRSDWERMHSGADNIGRTAVLDNGLKATTLGFSPEQMEEVENSGLTIRDAANFLGVPSSKLGDVGGVKYASKEQDDRNFLSDGLDFWLCAFAAEAWDKLLLESEKDAGTRLVDFDRETLISFDLATKANWYRTATGGRGWMSPAEVREREKMEPRDDEGIDAVLVPLNMGQGGADNDPEDMSDPDAGRPSEEDGAVDEGGAAARGAAETALLHAAGKMINRVAFHARRAAKDGAKYQEFVETLEADHWTVFRSEFKPAEAVARAVNGDGVPGDGQAAEWLLQSLVSDFGRALDTATPKSLAKDVGVLVANMRANLPKQLVVTFLG